MAKFKIAAGAEIDVMSKDEAEHVIQKSRASWVAEIAAGVKFRRFSASSYVRQDASLTIGGPEDPFNDLGPADGFVWDVRRLRITGHAPADTIGVYVGDMSASQLIATTKDVIGSLFTFDKQAILQPGEQLVIGGQALTTGGGTYVTVSGQVRELPVSLAWRLGS